MIFFRSSWRLMPSAVCWSKMVLRLSVSFSLARVMWRSNLSSGTSFLCLDSINAFWCSINKILCYTPLCYATLCYDVLRSIGILLCFTSLRSAGLNRANLCVGMLCCDVTLLCLAVLTILSSDTLHFTVRRNAPLNLAKLCWDITVLCFTGLHETELRCTPLGYAMFGCNFAILNFATVCSASPD